jgi:subtilase family serine protease
MKILLMAVVLAMAPVTLYAQTDSDIIVPPSSVLRAEDFGLRMRTHFLLRAGTDASAPSGETPQSIRSVYNLPSTGGGGIIAIVDAFHYPTAEADLNTFSSQFGLPACTTASGCFTVVFASGTQPAVNCGWNQEAALDLQWAHAMAPDAKIVLVEAQSNSNTDLYHAVQVASTHIAQNGGSGQVSMSWGGAEYSTETSDDSNFTTPGVVYLASSGDTGAATEYPSASPNVVAAGGTTINRNGSGVFTTETAWSGSGGGKSRFEPRPVYQDGVASTVGSMRGIPDMSFDANPKTGVSVFTGFTCHGSSGWLVFGGTSVSAQSLAGIVNLAGNFAASSHDELSTIYSNIGSADFRDITKGFAFSGIGGFERARAGWDFITGVGSPLGLNGK